MLSNVDELSEDFAGYPIVSAVNYYSGYYQIPLDRSSQNMTAFMTIIGLLRMTRMQQRWTNSFSNEEENNVDSANIRNVYGAIC